MKSKIIAAIVVVIIISSTVSEKLFITNVKTNADWCVHPHKQITEKTLNEKLVGTFYAIGRYYSKPLAPLSIAHHRYNGIQQEHPLFMVIAEYPVQYIGNEGGIGACDHDVAMFTIHDKEVHVPVDVPAGGFFSSFPQTQGNNVFLLKTNQTLKALPYRLETKEQVEQVRLALMRAGSEGYIPAVVNELEKIKTANQQVDPIVTTPVDEVEAQGTQGHP